MGKQVVQHVTKSTAICNMTPDVDGLTNYRKCSRPSGLADGGAIETEGYDGDLAVGFRTDKAHMYALN